MVNAPFFVQTVFGILGGIDSRPDDVMHMKCTTDPLFDDDCRSSVLGAGRSQMPIAAMAASMGGNVRVGLEDSLCARRRGKLAREGFGLEIVTPAEASAILQLKGIAEVAF